VIDPEQSAQTIRSAVEEAREAGQRIRLRGAGSKAFLAGAAATDLLPTVVSSADHSGVCEYRPEELVIEAYAGTPLAEIKATLAAQRQMLPFEPPEFGGAGTLGGAIASGLSGPGRPWFGAARDAVLGIEMINGLAQRLRFGGQVMKNVAGYDVARLMCGSGGALGALLSASLRVRPCPEKECTLVFELESDQALARVVELGRQAIPLSATCHTGRRLVLRLSGSSVEVDASARQLGGEAGEPGSGRSSNTSIRHSSGSSA
jgi:glycolate oxidase FAD binding subunit